MKITNAWGLKNLKTGRVYKLTFGNKKEAEYNSYPPEEKVIRVSIKEVRK